MLTSLVSLYQGSVKKSEKSMKIVNIDRENLHIFWTTWAILMKFSGKLRNMIILKATKKQGFSLSLSLSLEGIFLEKPQERWGGEGSSSFSRYLTFCLKFLVTQKNHSIRKIKLISKFMTPQCAKPAIAIQILPNNSRNKGTQTMKFAQLTDYNLRNNFLPKSCSICGEETSPKFFSNVY